MPLYGDIYTRSREDRDGFWLDAAQAIDWDRPPTVALDARNALLYKWFPDGGAQYLP